MLGLGASTEFREPDDGNLGELLKSQLVEPPPKRLFFFPLLSGQLFLCEAGELRGWLEAAQGSPASSRRRRCRVQRCSLTALPHFVEHSSDADSWTPEWATRRLPSPTRDAARLGARSECLNEAESSETWYL